MSLKGFILLSAALLGLSQAQCPPDELYGKASWPSAQVGEVVSGTCIPGWTGNPQRLCQNDGIWASSISSPCIRVYCSPTTEQNANWPITPALSSQVGECFPGYGGSVTRLCDANGQWGEPSGSCLKCLGESYSNVQWVDTPANSLASGTCDPGFIGNPSRWCDADGSWQAYVWSACQRRKCAGGLSDNAFWPSTNTLEVATGTCANGFSGNPTRQCNADGTFGPVISDPCVPQSVCQSESFASATWPTTPTKSLAEGKCEPGWFGNPQRECQFDATWSSDIGNPCQRYTCEAETSDTTSWPTTNSNEIALGTCLPGYLGKPSRICQSDGTWGEITSPCLSSSTTCPTETYLRATWPDTYVGSTATGVCQEGWVGAPQRKCSQNGLWDEVVSAHCRRMICPGGTYDNAHWPNLQANSHITGICLSEYVGNPSRTCQSDGTWSQTSDPCVLATSIVCPENVYARATWSASTAGAVAVGTCAEGWEGAPTRTCLPDGWSPLVSNHCVRKTCPGGIVDGISFPSAYPGTRVIGKCPEGTSPANGPERYCDATGSWIQMIHGSCN